MGIVSRYRFDDAAPVAVQWSRPSSEIVTALRHAVADELLVADPRGGRRVYRIRGSVEGRGVTLRVSVSATHATTWPYVLVTGDVRDVGAGSEFRGTATLYPRVPSGTWVLVLAADGAIGVLLIVGGLLSLLPLFAVGFVLLLVGPDLRRPLLRRRARDVAALVTFLGGTEPGP